MRKLIVSILFWSAAACAQDPDWVRAWEAVQRTRPAEIGSIARIAPAGEPGTPLVIHGRLFQSDGVTPVAGVIVFAYQTDRTGVYSPRGGMDWRLRGWARTDASGRFEFRTIRPASYPTGRTPAHVHFSIEGPGVPRRWTEELRFADDPFLSAEEKRASNVRPVETRDGAQHVDVPMRIVERGRF